MSLWRQPKTTRFGSACEGKGTRLNREFQHRLVCQGEVRWPVQSGAGSSPTPLLTVEQVLSCPRSRAWSGALKTCFSAATRDRCGIRLMSRQSRPRPSVGAPNTAGRSRSGRCALARLDQWRTGNEVAHPSLAPLQALASRFPINRAGSYRIGQQFRRDIRVRNQGLAQQVTRHWSEVQHKRHAS